MRKTDDELVPYYTRAEIDQGALKGRGLELLYLDDPVELFFMQVQGSGRVRLPDGRMVRLGYDGQERASLYLDRQAARRAGREDKPQDHDDAGDQGLAARRHGARRSD